MLSQFHSRRTTSIIRRLTDGLRLALDECQKKGQALDNLNIELIKKVKETEKLAEELRLSKEDGLQLIDGLTPGVIGNSQPAQIGQKKVAGGSHFRRKAAYFERIRKSLY